MPTHSYVSHDMATLNYRTPSAATAPTNGGQAHHHHHHHQRHNNHHSSGVPKSMFGMYGSTSNHGPNAGGFLQQQQRQQYQHQVQPPQHRIQQSAMYAPPSMVQQIPSPVTVPSTVEEDEDDFLSEITVQFDDGVQTLYVGPVEIIDTKGSVDEQRQQPSKTVPPPATSIVRSRERFQEERAIVTLEPVGGKTKSQPLPMYLQQQQQHQEQQQKKLQQKQQQKLQQKQQQQQQHQEQQQKKLQQKQQQKQQQQQQLQQKQQQQQLLQQQYQQQLRQQISQHHLQQQLHQQQQLQQQQLQHQQLQQQQLQQQQLQQQQLQQQQQQLQQQKVSQIQPKPRLKQSKGKPQKQQELLKQRQHQQTQQPPPQPQHQQNDVQRIQEMRLKQQALLQQMNLMKEFSPEQLFLLQQQSSLKSLNDLQLSLNAQFQHNQQQPSRSVSTSSGNSINDWQQTQQEILYQQQFALRFQQQMQNNQQLQVVQNLPEKVLPPPATASRSKACVKQAPMLNFAMHNVPSGSSSNTNNQPKIATGAVKRSLSTVVDELRPVERHMDPPVTQPAAKRPAHVTETTGPIGDIAPATVLRSPPTPTQMVTIRVAAEAQPQQQHQPPVLLTQLKQEPMTEEQCVENVIPDVVVPSSSPPPLPPPSPTTPLVEMKPSLAAVVAKAAEPPSSPNATIMASSCTERTVASLAAVMISSSKRLDDDVPAAVDDVPVLSVAEVPHVPNGCSNSSSSSSIGTVRERQNSKDDEIHSPMTMNGTTQQWQNEEEQMQEMASPSLPVTAAVNNASEQTKLVVKRGRGRPPKSPHQKPAATPKVVTELSAPEETDTTTTVEDVRDVTSDLGESINISVESQAGEVKKSSKKKGYISVGALFASTKSARKQQKLVNVAKKEEISTAIAAEPAPDRNEVVEEPVEAVNTTAVTNAANELVIAENKTEQMISISDVSVAVNGGEDEKEINGLSNLQEEITVQPSLPVVGKTREESVVSGDGGESSVSSLAEESVSSSVAQQSTNLLPDAVPDTEKESSPASDSGIESVIETGTSNASKKGKERSRSCLLSLPSSLNLEDKAKRKCDSPAVKVENEQKSRVVSRRQTIANAESNKKDNNDDEEKIGRKGKRSVRANRKPSAKAKEAAEAAEAAKAAEVAEAAETAEPAEAIEAAEAGEAAEADEAAEAAEATETAEVAEAAEAVESAHSVSLSSRDELKCPKCKMQFKTDLWYRKHLLNYHDIQLDQNMQLLSDDGPSTGIEDESMPSPPSTAVEPEPLVSVDGSLKGDENWTENNVATDETPIEEFAGEIPQNDTETEQTLKPVEVVLSKIKLPVVESKVSGSRKRKSTPHSTANSSIEEAPNNEKAPSLDATLVASNGSNASEELLLPAVTNVKLEYRTPATHSSNLADEDDEDEAEGSDELGSSPQPNAKNRSKAARRKLLVVTPPVVEATTTKVEKVDPDDPEKLTPFEANKVTMIESELTGETHYTCTICGGQFTGKSAVKEHLATTHAAVKRRSCEYCGRTFLQTGDLTRHTRIHTGYRPFKCPVVECSFAFISSGDLHKHVRRHNKQPLPKPHVCDQCGKDFERSYDLKRHMTMHAKSEPDFKGISCGVCGKVFARQDQFRAHTYRHIGYRPYQCEICGKAFTDPSNYSKHARLHEMDGVELVCNFCGRLFKNKSAISKHIFHCQQKTSDARKASGSKKRGSGTDTTKKEGKKGRRVGMAVGYGKESGDDTAAGLVNPKQENLTYDEERPIVTKRELVDSEMESGSPSRGGAAGCTKQQKQQQASKKRKKRRQRTPSSTEEEEEDDDDDSGQDYIGPSSSSDQYGTPAVVVKRDRRSRKLSLAQYDADK